MNKEEMLKRLKDIHLLYSMPMMAQNMRQEHYAIVEYEKLAYEQQAIITQLTNNWNELEEYIIKQEEINNGAMKCGLSSDSEINEMGIQNDIYDLILDKMKEIQNGSDE